MSEKEALQKVEWGVASCSPLRRGIVYSRATCFQSSFDMCILCAYAFLAACGVFRYPPPPKVLPGP